MDARLGAVGAHYAIRLSRHRRVQMDAYEAMPAGHKMFALVDVDVTSIVELVRRERRGGERVSVFAHVIAAIGRALACFPMLNAIHRGGRVFCFDDVDISIPLDVDVVTRAEHEVRQLVVRHADEKSAREIYSELEAARARLAIDGESGGEDHWTRALGTWGRLLPRFLRLFLLRRLVRSPRMAKRFAGTTSVTSLAKFHAPRGYAVPPPASPLVTSFALGREAQVPIVVADEVVARWLLPLTMVIDHDVVDGGEAASFLERLQTLLTEPEHDEQDPQ